MDVSDSLPRKKQKKKLLALCHTLLAIKAGVKPCTSAQKRGRRGCFSECVCVCERGSASQDCRSDPFRSFASCVRSHMVCGRYHNHVQFISQQKRRVTDCHRRHNGDSLKTSFVRLFGLHFTDYTISDSPHRDRLTLFHYI